LSLRARSGRRRRAGVRTQRLRWKDQ
jgi:hypothetical protein